MCLFLLALHRPGCFDSLVYVGVVDAVASRCRIAEEAFRFQHQGIETLDHLDRCLLARSSRIKSGHGQNSIP
ncbi:TPA: hypothetical protein L6A21_16200 [Pseudomonas aeruginosa]|nr:hypothetical protein APB53_04175 [Pseudomonas aeruginosa]RCI68684.1 hypothetical protein DT383_02185 [Pseudomonas aeruginosa]HBP6520556.1 hypothetical protein [Pseudomonas aeruginosa]